MGAIFKGNQQWMGEGEQKEVTGGGQKKKGQGEPIR